MAWPVRIIIPSYGRIVIRVTLLTIKITEFHDDIRTNLYRSFKLVIIVTIRISNLNDLARLIIPIFRVGITIQNLVSYLELAPVTILYLKAHAAHLQANSC